MPCFLMCPLISTGSKFIKIRSGLLNHYSMSVFHPLPILRWRLPKQENIVFLVPVASGLGDDSEELREKYFQLIARRMEKHLGESILDSVVYKKTFSVSDFVKDYNSFRGNAYGLANTLMQTAIFRPSCQSSKVKNLLYRPAHRTRPRCSTFPDQW